MYQIYTNLAHVPPTYRGVKKLQVLITNKDVRKPLGRKNGNDNPIWSWNNSPVITKGRKVTVNSKGEQEPIADSTRSQVYLPSNLPPFEAHIQLIDETVSMRMGYCTVSHNFTTPSRSRYFSAQMLTNSAYYVLDNDTGKRINYGQMRKHPKYKETRNTSFSNEMGRLCQGIGKGKNGLGKRI